MNRLRTTKLLQCWLIRLAPVMARAAEPLGATPHAAEIPTNAVSSNRSNLNLP
jgi:hypothetical protein